MSRYVVAILLSTAVVVSEEPPGDADRKQEHAIQTLITAFVKSRSARDESGDIWHECTPALLSEIQVQFINRDEAVGNAREVVWCSATGAMYTRVRYRVVRREGNWQIKAAERGPRRIALIE